MAEGYKIFPLRAQPGIKRDGTSTEGTFWDDGLWTRFYRGLPRSILGYRSMTGAFPGPSRGLFVDTGVVSGYFNVFSGSSSNLSVGAFTNAGVGGGITDITPSGFVASSDNAWQLDSFFNSNGGGATDLIAHAAPNLSDIGSAVNRQVYYGNIDSVAPLVGAVDDSNNPFKVSGGICAIHPYAVAYGNNGQVSWSALNDPTTWPVANAANPVSSKIVKGLSIRGNSAPAALLWSLDSLISMVFVGGAPVWQFSTISDQSSILSSSGVVEKDGIYYWPGIDRFLVYNGSLVELPNEMNLDFFYSNLNYAQRQKVFGFKIPRWGEICWCAPLFGATECNWMFIYNVRENTWYDTPLPGDGRSAAYFAQAWQYPILSGAQPFSDGNYQLWQHEYGNSAIHANNTDAIPSYVISPPISLVSGGLTLLGSVASQPRWTQLVGFEPDFLFNQNISIDILTRKYAQDSDLVAQSNTVSKGGKNYFDTQEQARYIRFKISVNEQGGYYVMGTPLILWREGDAQP